MKTLTTACILTLSLAAWACGSTAESPEGDDPQTEQVSLPLYEEKLDDGSVLRFYESEDDPGFISTIIATSIDAPPPSEIPASERVTEVYQTYRPGAEVPQVLLQAQQRQDAFLALQAEQSEAGGGELSEDSDATAALAAEVGGAVEGALDTEDDYLAWRTWAWALGTKGRWDRRWLNYASSQTTSNAEGYYAAVVASENGYVTWRMNYRPGLSWKNAWSVTVQPGEVYHWFHNSDNNWDYKSGVYDVTSAEYYHHAGAYQY